MSIIRAPRRQRFTTVDRCTINDDRLSFRARGILIWILDKPDNWSVRSDAIAAQGTEGREAVRTALRELEEFGYLVREKHQDAKGQWCSDAFVYERPADAQKPDSGFSGAVTNTENEDLLPPTGVPDEISPEIGALVAGYVDDYKLECGGHEPDREFRNACGRAVKRALKNGEDPGDIAICLGVIAHEGKNPNTLAYVLGDYHANRPRRIR